MELHGFVSGLLYKVPPRSPELDENNAKPLHFGVFGFRNKMATMIKLVDIAAPAGQFLLHFQYKLGEMGRNWVEFG